MLPILTIAFSICILVQYIHTSLSVLFSIHKKYVQESDIMRLSESYFPKRNLAWAHASSPAWSTYGRQGVQVPACNTMGSIRSELQLIY